MDEEGYFIIWSGESGIDIKGPLTEAEALRWLSPDSVFADEVPPIDDGHFAVRGEPPILLLKGRIVIPHKIQVATKLRMP
jgi:hypothetical protein